MVSASSQVKRARKSKAPAAVAPQAVVVEVPAMKAPAYKVRIEAVDNWHPEWSVVLAAILRSGQEESLMVDEDGWLSARRTVLAAFGGRRVVAYLCFHVAPMTCPEGRIALEHGRPLLEARLDALWVAPDAAGQGLDRVLTGMAESHAIMLQCRTFRHDANDVC